jgi:ABC-2 type transport system permease protein
MNMTLLTTQLKREFWEHKKGFFYTPLIMTALILMVILAIALKSGDMYIKQGSNAPNYSLHINGDIDMGDGEKIDLSSIDLSTADKEHPKFFGMPTMFAIGANTILLIIVSFVVQLIYAHSCLFDDRKNRDILFWRSMPVGENTNVLVKLGFLLLLSPLLILALNIVLGLVTFLISAIFFMAHDISFVRIMTSVDKSELISMAIKALGADLLVTLLLTPVFSFILFCSALAKKSPVFTSSLIPIVLVVVDKTFRVFFGINLHIIDTLSAYWSTLGHVIQGMTDGHFELDSNVLTTAVISVLIASLFIYTAIWLRNNRYEL